MKCNQINHRATGMDWDSARQTSFPRRLLSGAALLASLLLAWSAGTANATEYRAFWVDGWGAGYENQSQVNTLLGVPGTSTGGQIRDANCNAVFVEVRRNCDACYPSSMGEPYMSGLSPANFNALQAMINAAHDTTGGKKRIEVHCWMVTFRTSGGTVYSQHSSTPTGSLTTLDNYWPSRDQTGAEVTDQAFDPGHPLALQYTVNVAMDLVKNFDIDGIHYDYIRFTANNQGYNPTSIARYNARYGLIGQPAYTDEQFKQWRRDQVSAVVRQVYAKIQKSKPSVKQSGSFVTWNPSPTSSTRAGFQGTRPYYDVYSDWDSWMQEGIVDMAVPMTYYNWASLPTDYTKWMNFEKDRKFNRQMIIGPGIYLNSLANAILELQMTRTASPAGNYAQGFSGYSYGTPYLSGTWGGFSPSLVSQVTPTWDDIPTMPWKTSPTTGHLMGTVTITGTGAWADGATVSITGPANRSMYVDGTGFYAFIDLPPGSYTVTASKTGYPDASATVNVAVGAVTGNMYQQDFVLGANTPPTISTQPLSQTVNQGANATFTVTASGTTPLYYQWRLYATNIAGATASSYTRTSVQPADGGPYSVVVSNTASTVTSSNALLTVIVPPAIITQPLSQTITQGTGVTFSVGVSGTAPFSYQWRFNGANISGATTSSCTRGNVQPADAGSYSVIVTNPAGSPTSSNAVLIVISPPAITTQPQGQTVVLGGTASFNVLATGTAPLAYQWRLNGADIGGATAISYTRASVQATDAGDYSVLVTNAYGAMLSSNATLVVDTNVTLPVITSQPQSQIVIAGQSATFSVTATNKAPLSYQWRFNAVPIPGATDSAYTRNNVQTNDAGSYSVVITNIVGSTTSADAVLTVNFSLAATASMGGSVSKSPDQASYAPNAVVTLTTTADTGYIFTGWAGDAGGTNDPLAVTMTANKAIHATFASIATDIILDNTNAAVTFTGGWQTGTSSTDKYGPDYRFASTADGGLSNAIYRPYIYAPGYYDVSIWYPQGGNRATNAPWTVVYDGGSTHLAVNQTANGGGWRVIAAARPFAQGTNGCVSLSNDTGSAGAVVMADAVRFSFVGPIIIAPVITQQPQSQTVTQGASVTVTVAASGTTPLSYQWAFNGVGIGAATTSVYTLVHAQPADAGSYSVVVSNSAGSTTSSNVLLTVNVPPGITTQPHDQNVNQGSNTTFTVVATGTPTPAYQWRVNGTDIAGATGASYVLADAQPANAGSYSVVVSNIAGKVTSTDALLTVNVPPGITTQPHDQNVNQGRNATFTVVATGTPAPAYQWRFNGTNIVGATDTGYTLTNAQPANAGSYSVVASNVAGSATSSNAVLTVNVPPTITAQPQSVTVTAGSNVTFTVTATGTLPISYQWRFNGTNLAYATASAYACNNAQTKDAGSYSVVVSNLAGTLASVDAVLTVTQPTPLQIDWIRLTPEGQIQLQVSGLPGHYAIEAASNLVNWAELTNFTTTNTTFQHLDAETNLLQRFYRIRLVQ